MRILITGAAGQLAQALLSIVELSQVNLDNSIELTPAQKMLVTSLPEAMECIAITDEVIGLSHQQLDICDSHSIEAALDAFRPDVVINCAAYNAVDKAEIDIERAMAVNAIGPKLLANACLHRNMKLVHISTDFVFDGAKVGAYTEQDAPEPLSIYGQSKLKGERWISEILGDKATIVRTSWLYSSWGQNFVKTMQGLVKTKESLSVISDQLGSPTWCEALAVTLFLLVKRTPLKNLPKKMVSEGLSVKRETHLFHYAGSGVASWYEFACEVQRQTLAITEPKLKTVDCLIQPITTQAWQGLHKSPLAQRPKQSALVAQKLCHQLAIKPRSLLNAPWQQQLAAMIEYQKVRSRES